MSIRDFLSNENAQMLWEVLIDNESIAKNKRTQDVFAELLPKFYERESSNPAIGSLMQLNKSFISLIMGLLKPEQQYSQPQPQSRPKELITYEELQTERNTIFEKELLRKQTEFTSAMTVPIPEVPQFADNSRDEPLSEMEMIIKRTIAERNLEMEKIHSSTNKSNAEQWLKSAQTSVKEDKIKMPVAPPQSELSVVNREPDNMRNQPRPLKFIRIEQEELSMTIQAEELMPAKHISWAESEDIISRRNPVSLPLIRESNSPMDFFSHLKTIEEPPILAEKTELSGNLTLEYSILDHINARFDRLEQLINKKNEMIYIRNNNE